MLAQLRSSLTYANVMATVAMFVALGGTSYAVATGSIDSRELKNETVRSKDIRNNQVSTRDLRNNSARGGDIRNDTLTGTDVLESSLGEVPSATTAGNANQLGGVGAAGYLQTGTRVLQANRAIAENFADSETILSLDLPAGQWAVVAKLSMDNDDSVIDVGFACDLSVPGDNDDQTPFAISEDFPGGPDLVVVSMTATTAGGGPASISCLNDGDNDAANIRIVAMNVG
jgi:hypothetical protein